MEIRNPGDSEGVSPQQAPCRCTYVTFSCASLIPQPWMQTPKHIPATRCGCGKRYYSWAKEKEFACKTIAGE